MADAPFTHMEQDEHDVMGEPDGLPTYDDLAEKQGPNSRFGRWRGWIEKRAAERYNDVSAQERRTENRGWGGEDEELFSEQPPAAFDRPGGIPSLKLQTDFGSSGPPPAEAFTPRAEAAAPIPIEAETLHPTHLKLMHFGSRFLPHASAQIHCLLPLLGNRLLLIGHDNGLSVLDLYPREWSETAGLIEKGPEDAVARHIWEGEGVYQMSILESEDTGKGALQGVVLALVGPTESRTLRMYNLASLTSLAKYACAQRGPLPLDLGRPTNWTSPVKRGHKASASVSNSISRGIKSLLDAQSPTTHQELSPFMLTASNSSPKRTPLGGRSSPISPTHRSGQIPPALPPRPGVIPVRRNDSDDSSWDVVEDLPLRWASDFVPLASAGSRLVNISVLSFALWKGDKTPSHSGAMLAVATKSNILLYETPRGERAFKFMKEFYTPLQPRCITFMQQSVEEISRSASDARYQRGGGDPFPQSTRSTSGYGPQLSIFVVFDKKASWIRLADSAVGEFDMYDDGTQSAAHLRESLSVSGINNGRRSRASFDGHNVVKESKGHWSLPTRIDLPSSSSMTSVNVLTRGKHTHIVPFPMPSQTGYLPPLASTIWEYAPLSVTPRLCYTAAGQPFLQLVAVGNDGIEVQELPLEFLNAGKGKGKAPALGRSEEPRRTQLDLGGDAGFLSLGGNWDRPAGGASGATPLSRSMSAVSEVTARSSDTLETQELDARARRQQGFYGWSRKGRQNDFRVFWVGGSS